MAEHSLCHHAYMADLAALKVNGILYLKLAVFIGNDTLIALLAAHGAVKGGRIRDNGSGLAVCKSLYKLSSVVSTEIFDSTVSLS